MMTPTTRGRRGRVCGDLRVAMFKVTRVLYIEREERQSSQDRQSRLIRRRVRRKHPLDVLGEDVELDVQRIADLGAFEVGVEFRVGNDPNRETFRQDFSDCETDSIDGNRSFGRYVMCKFGG